jgi:hypothetical protein
METIFPGDQPTAAGIERSRPFFSPSMTVTERRIVWEFELNRLGRNCLGK